MGLALRRLALGNHVHGPVDSRPEDLPSSSARRRIAQACATRTDDRAGRFRAGFASIGCLRELRFDEIKLDGALVTAAQHGSDAERLLSAVVALCHILGVSTVAEHIENQELARLLTRLGCTAGQGFWLHRPVCARRLKVFSAVDMDMDVRQSAPLRWKAA